MGALGRVTDLPRIGVTERKVPGSKQVLPSVIDRAWCEDVRSYGVLQSRDQFNVKPESETPVTVAQ